MIDPLIDHIEQSRTLAIAQRNAREAERVAREMHLELVILRHIAGRPWWWHLGCAATTVVERVAERAVAAARRVLDGPEAS